ncbi:TBC1 domain family member 24-like [Ambystoma mexicanum]|uniref:TBC1 domain family member 24-like n=1 Tax=Ambystoma mexicanum TaxID=8296 RepID=UPI0037E8B84A
MGECTKFLRERTISPPIPLQITPEIEILDINTTSAEVDYGQFVDWHKMPVLNPDENHHRHELTHNLKELKKMARDGHFAHSHNLRAQAYSQIIRGLNCRIVTPDGPVYQDISERLFGNRDVSTHPLPDFLDEILMPTYYLNKQGVTAIQKVLICISNQFPDITYSPTLPVVVALLLHYSTSEAHCFEQICRLIACMDTQKCYIDQSLLAHEASCMTFGDLAKKHCQAGHKLIATTSDNIFEVYCEWVLWVFGDLPFEYVIRVFDAYLLEGSKVLYRVALALLKQYRYFATSREAEITDVKQDMQNFVQNIAQHLPVDKLLEKAFRIRLFSHKEIWLLQLANRKALSERGITVTQRRQPAYMSLDILSCSSTIITAQEMRIVWSWIPERFALLPPVLLYSTADHGYSLQRFYAHCEGHAPTVLLIKTTAGEICGAFLSSDWNERKQHCGQVCTFFGTGECFVFSVRPEIEKYLWVVVRRAELRKAAPPSPRPRSRSRSSSFGSSSLTPMPCLSTSPSATSNYLSVPVQGAVERLSPYLSIRHFKLPSKTASMFMSGSQEGIIIGGGGGQALNIDANLNHGRTEPCETFDNPSLCQENFQVQALEVWGFQNS